METFFDEFSQKLASVESKIDEESKQHQESRKFILEQFHRFLGITAQTDVTLIKAESTFEVTSFQQFDRVEIIGKSKFISE